MTVVLTSPVEGLQPGDNYTGANEAYHLASGYASQAGYATDVAAKLTGGTNAVNVVTGGDIVIRVDNTETTVAIADADTPAAAATKIDTALAGQADAAIVSSKLEITTVGTGSSSSVQVVSGTGTVLANLGVTAGQSAVGSDGGPGVANTGPADTTIANNREFDATRGDIAADSDLPVGGTNDGIVTKAYPAVTIGYTGN